MVKVFHDAGIKVFLDVVYNHHGEGDVDRDTGTVGAIYSLRGVDNASYYEHVADSLPPRYQNDNGVGPNLNAASPLCRDLVIASLKYWSTSLGVDGFRFDLAAVLGNANRSGGYKFDRDDPDNILNRAVRELPARPAQGGAGVDLIAEPYTAGSDGQEQGNFPVGWSEWNDRYRDTVRASQNINFSDNVSEDQRPLLVSEFGNVHDRRLSAHGERPRARNRSSDPANRVARVPAVTEE